MNFRDLSGQTFGNLVAIKRIEDKKYKNTNYVQWLCKCKCGRITEVLACNLTNGNSQSCGHCNNNSHGNTKIDMILSKHNIPFVREKRFDNCRDKLSLPFDFFVNNEYCIEFDGRQHSDTNSLYNRSDIYKHDKIKNEYCKINNIPLIRIPYTHLKNLTIEDLQLETSKFIADYKSRN